MAKRAKANFRKTSMKQTARAVRSYCFLVASYFLLILFLPADQVSMHNYMLSATEYRVLRFSLALPLVLMWFAAFFGYAKLQQYAQTIAKTPEASGYQRLANGCRWLAWGLSTTSIASIILNTNGDNHPRFHSLAIIIINYMSLLYALIAFSVMSGGAHDLATRAKQSLTPATTRSLQLIFVISGVIYCYLTFKHLDLQSLASTNNPYYLPVWLLVISVIIPNLYAWFVGLLAVHDLGIAARRTHGVLYRRAVRFLASGLVLVIASLISVQYLHSAIPRSGHLSLDTTLIVTYATYLVTMIGFILVSLGANRLKRIEEV
jgi:hypothetical protein